ncbi:MAG: efflux RND transporter periplasmic adaptor subunit [Bacteroidota bacterium]
MCMLVLLPLILLASCGESNDKEREDSRPVLAEGYLVQPEYHVVSIRATGDLLANEEVEIKAPVAGNVRKIYFRESQFVNRGELLVDIDNRSWVAQKKGLEARLISAEGELRRKTKLLETQVISEEEVEQSAADVGSLKAQVEGLDVMIDLAAVRAPFAGRLGMRNFSPGAYLSQGSVITRLVQTDKVKVNFTVPAKYAAQAAAGQEVKVISSSGDTASAEVYAVNARISQSSRSLQIRAIMNKKHPSFIPGDFVQVLLVVERKTDALLIPAECIVPELKKQVVFVISDGKAMRREVETGSRTSDRVEILKGLSPGDTVLTTGLMEVKDGDRIELQKLNGSEAQ